MSCENCDYIYIKKWFGNTSGYYCVLSGKKIPNEKKTPKWCKKGELK